MSSYEINAPVTFINTTAGDVLNFDSDSTLPKNVVRNFVTNTAGDIIYRAAGGVNNLARLPIGTSGQVLTVSGGLPAWGSNSATTSGFSVGKTAGDTFTTPASTIGNWNTTNPTANPTNPFFNVDIVLTLGTGKFVAPTTGTYAIDAHIEYTSTNNAGTRSLTFAEETVGPVYTTIAGENNIQQTGNIAATQFLDIHAAVKLAAGSTYVLRIVATAGTGTIMASSRYSIVLIGL